MTAKQFYQQIDEIRQIYRVCYKYWSLQMTRFCYVIVPAHQKLNEVGYETIPPSPYSPDFSPTDYHFFNHLDNFLREQCFTNDTVVKNAFENKEK